MQEDHPVADFLDVAHVVRGVEDADLALALHASDGLAHLVGDVGIKARGRFIEQEQLGIVQQRLAEVEPRAFSGGKLAGHPFAQIAYFEKLQKIGDLLLRIRHAVDAGEHQQILPDEQIAGEGSVGAGEVHAFEEVDAVLEKVAPERTDAARGWRGEAQQHVHRGGLAGAVRAEQTQDLAPAELETESVHGHDAVELADEVAGFENDFAFGGLAHRRAATVAYAAMLQGGFVLLTHIFKS